LSFATVASFATSIPANRIVHEFNVQERLTKIKREKKKLRRVPKIGERESNYGRKRRPI